MNNYMRVLLHLKQFEGDGRMHPVDELLTQCTRSEQVEILRELEAKGYIVTQGTERTYENYYVEVNPLTKKTVAYPDPSNAYYLDGERELLARLTFEGSIYLKEELQMQQKGAYSNSVYIYGSSTNNNVVMDSQQSTITNNVEQLNKFDEIIKSIEHDPAIEPTLKESAVQTLQQAKEETAQHGRPAMKTILKLVELGASLSSIGAFIAQMSNGGF